MSHFISKIGWLIQTHFVDADAWQIGAFACGTDEEHLVRASWLAGSFLDGEHQAATSASLLQKPHSSVDLAIIFHMYIPG